jgi:hypothetical protein
MVQDRHKRKAALLGVGLDNNDGHVRVTKGENFHLVGGSQETHESMQEKCIKFNEKLKDRGKKLHQLEKAELMDIASDCRMNVELPKGDD